VIYFQFLVVSPFSINQVIHPSNLSINTHTYIHTSSSHLNHQIITHHPPNQRTTPQPTSLSLHLPNTPHQPPHSTPTPTTRNHARSPQILPPHFRRLPHRGHNPNRHGRQQRRRQHRRRAHALATSTRECAAGAFRGCVAGVTRVVRGE
jgi:hypothetical protein